MIDFSYVAKELSFYHKLWFYNRHIFSTWWCKPLICQTIIIWSKMIHSLKYLRSPTIKCKDIGIRKSEFVTKTQFFSQWMISSRTLESWFLRNSTFGSLSGTEFLLETCLLDQGPNLRNLSDVTELPTAGSNSFNSTPKQLLLIQCHMTLFLYLSKEYFMELEQICLQIKCILVSGTHTFHEKGVIYL